MHSEILSFLGVIHDCQAELERYTSGLLLRHHIADDVELTHDIILRRAGHGLEVELVHSFNVYGDDAPGGSEVRFVAKIEMSETACAASMTIRAELDAAIGGLPAGRHVLQESRATFSSIDEATGFLREAVGLLCQQENPFGSLVEQS